MKQIVKDMKLKNHPKKIYLYGAVTIFSFTALFLLSRHVKRQFLWNHSAAQKQAEEDLPSCPPGTVLSRVSKFKGSFENIEQLDIKDEANYQAEWRCDPSQPATEEAKTFSDLFCGCSDDYQPVCGGDYYTHQNTCVAKCIGTTVAYQGECRIYKKETPSAGCLACTDKCPDNQVFYEDEKGCPVCECRLGEGQW
ncbi:MAG TPA: hypothetical protein VMW41_02730 [Candidatus Bathyarchaeia archaeon]|nr:hypothetical protein [Candidatus Bathyarchaeia archaeon]